jgi:NAD(P)-dependent dehydrogenase (short-subunit alcohol dehydrogenase family)
VYGLLQTNAISYAHLFSAYIPLILEGRAKKVIALSTGMADVELTRKYDVWMGASYAIAKAALNMIVAKFSAEYREKGVLFLSISPGFVNTSDTSGGKCSIVPPRDVSTRTDSNLAPEPVLKALSAMVGKFQDYAPDWKGAITPAESVRMVLHVIEEASVEKGDGGNFVSHFGNTQWL